MITRKQIETKFPNFEVIANGGRWGYSVKFKPWGVQNACVLKGMKLDGIYRFVKEQNEYYEENGTFNWSYFRHPDEVARRDKEVEEYRKKHGL
jgi:hypothetical protein